MTRRLLIAFIAIVMLYTIACFVRYYTLPSEVQAQTNTFCAANLTCNVSAAWNFTTLNSVRYADQFAGADCGAKINAADSNLGSTAGEIWVNQNCGLTISTAVNVSFAHTLRFIQGGLYTLSATMQVSGTGGGILGPAPTRVTGAGLGLPVVTIKEANAANLASMVSMNAGDSFIQNIALDGNKANNPTGGVGVLVNKAGGVHLAGSSIQNFNSDGVQVLSTAGTRNSEADTFKMFDTLVQFNGGAGVNCIATNDMFILFSEIIQNTGNGITLNDCGAARIGHNEISANGVENIKITGTLAGPGGANNKIWGNQFCCSAGHDIFINGWDSVSSSIQAHSNKISNNTFIGSSAVTNNLNPSVLLQDTQNNTVEDNTMNSVSGHAWKWQVQSVDVSSTSIGLNVITNNQTYAGAVQGNGTGAAPTGGIAALSGDSLTGNEMYSAPVGGQNFALANNTNLSFYNSSGALQGLVVLDSGNNALFGADSTAHFMAWRPNGIGSGTNQWSLVPSGMTTGGSITLGAGTGYNVTNLWEINTAPTIAAAGCGGGAASIVVSNGTAAFKINVGTTPASACTFTMPPAATGWNCFATDITTNSTSVFLQKQTGAESTTSVTITNFNDVAVATAFVASDILKVACSAD